MKNYRQSQFDNLQKKNVNKSLFNLSHEIKTQMCFGRYYPIHYEECLPGDEWEIDGEYQFRFPGMYFPIQQIGTMRADWFYVPYKLLWKGSTVFDTTNVQKRGWQGFIMGEDLELPTTKLNINGDGYSSSSGSQLYPGCSYPIENYLGFPYDTKDREDGNKQMSVEGSAFPLAMYLMCYDEYYRNPQWEEPKFFELSDGSLNHTEFSQVKQEINGIEYVSWEPTGGGTNPIINHAPFFAHFEKDYFTTARPQPQDGDAILIPSLGIEPDGTFTPQKVYKTDGTPPSPGDPLETGIDGVLKQNTDDVVLETNATIRQLRLYQVLQQFHERVMRIGKRYRGYIEGLWGNDPEPNAVDIPQLVGSHFGRIQITDTMTTADVPDGASTGNYRGNINFHNNGTTHRYYCQDYGLLMCILNVMPNTSYGQQIERKWTREVNTDFALDMFSGIGDQEIKRKELFAIGDNRVWSVAGADLGSQDDTIGYQDRFAEYKTRVNRVFNTSNIYNSFYMGSKPRGILSDYQNIDVAGFMLGHSNEALGNGIREVDIFNVQPIKSGNSTYLDSTIWAHIYLTLKVQRCLPYFSTPGKQIM